MLGRALLPLCAGRADADGRELDAPAEGRAVVPTRPEVPAVGRVEPFTVGRLEVPLAVGRLAVGRPDTPAWVLPTGCWARLLNEPGVLLPPWRTLAT